MTDTPVVATATQVAKKIEPFFDTVPCNWDIIRTSAETISASNFSSGEQFEGTVAEFNARLRG